LALGQPRWPLALGQPRLVTSQTHVTAR
jgi:hypothetical protein